MNLLTNGWVGLSGYLTVNQTQIFAKNANLKLTQDGCIEVPSSAFNSNLMEFPAQNEIPDLTLKLKAFFSIKSKYTHNSFEEIFDQRVLRSY